MKFKKRIFLRLFLIIVFALLLVFAVQQFARSLIFETLYVDVAHKNNIAEIQTIVSDIDSAGEQWLEALENHNNDQFFIRFHETSSIDVDSIHLEDLFYPDIEVLQVGDIYYQIIRSDYSNISIINGGILLVYYYEFDDKIVIFEQTLYGLVYANEAQRMLDMQITGILLLFMVPLIFWFSKRFTSPLSKMNKQLKAIKNLDFPPSLLLKQRDEIGELSDSINQVSDNLEVAIQKLQTDIEYEQAKDKKNKELIATLSHELKTPIASMRAIIEGMIDKIGKYQDRDIYLAESLEHLLFMEELTKSLIETMRLENQQLTLESVSIQEIVASSIRHLQPYLDESKRKIDIKIEDSIVLCNPKMIERVFMNIIHNAIKYSPKESQITLQCYQEKQNLIISVQNDSQYIPKEDLDRIFEAFYRVEKSRNRETGGSGLGLYIVKTILDYHHSEYQMRNTNTGVEFLFTLKLDTKLP